MSSLFDMHGWRVGDSFIVNESGDGECEQGTRVTFVAEYVEWVGLFVDLEGTEYCLADFQVDKIEV